ARARRAAGKTTQTKSNSSLASLGFIGVGIAGLWMGLAHAVGWMVRVVGRRAATAKRLDRPYRRDGAALLPVGLGLVLGVAIYSGGAGPAGRAIAVSTRFTVGTIAVVLPMLLLLGGIWLMRDPPDDAPSGRGFVGWTSLLIAVAGLLHLGKARPTDPAAMDRA